MTIDDYTDAVKLRLEGLSAAKRIAFAAAIAERFLPPYLGCTPYAWCNPPLIKRLLGEIWDHAKGDTMFSESRMAQITDELLKSSPDMDEDPEFDALDSCSILWLAVRSTAPNKASLFAAGTVETALQNVGRHSRSDLYDVQFSEHPRVRREIQLYERLLDYLAGAPAINDNTNAELRKLALSTA